MKNFLMALGVLMVFNVLFIYLGGLSLFMKTEPVTQGTAVSADVVDVFRFTLEDEVRKKIGAPSEGFEPYMFLEVFPGLVETDFKGVASSVGGYLIVDGRLVHKLDDTKLVHSAAKAITRSGFQVLLANISNRIDVDLATSGTITDVMSALTSER